MRFHKALLALSVILVVAWCRPAAGQTITMTVAEECAAAGATATLAVSVDDPTDISGAAFTVTYDGEFLTLIDLQSDFFDTFANQWAQIDPPPDPQPPDSVEVDGQLYVQPLLSNDITDATLIAAARVQGGASEPVLFRLTFAVDPAAPQGSYPVTIVQTILDNAAAGYPGGGEAVPILTAGDPNEPDLSLAFTPLDTATVAGAVTVPCAGTPVSFGDELAADFGGNGLWHFDGTTWSKKSNWDPQDDLAGWNGGVAVDFGAYGVWSHNGTAWSKMSTWTAEGLEGCLNGLFADFGGDCLWFYGGAAWHKKTSWNPENMACWSGGLAVDFGASGLWNFDGTTWSRLSGWNAGSSGLTGWSNGLMADFDGHGLWHHDGAAWTKKSNWNPDEIEGWSGGVMAVFGTDGLWNYDGTDWSKEPRPNPEGMSALGDGLAVDYGTDGLWQYNGTGWNKETAWNPQHMDDVDLNH
jgi:hypothetical protein